MIFEKHGYIILFISIVACGCGTKQYIAEQAEQIRTIADVYVNQPVTSVCCPTGNAYALVHKNTPNALCLFCRKGLSTASRVDAMDDKVLYTPDMQ